MSNGLPRSEPSPVAPTPAFAAHLDRFRRSTSSPTSSRMLPSPLTAPELTQSGHDSAGLACSSAALPQSPSAPPPLPRSTATPPRRSNGTSTITPTKKKKRPARPYADPSQYAELGDDPLPDYLEEGLDVLLCGINPGVKSAQMRLHYASPTNHFWKCLAGAGFTDGLLHPSQGPTLPSVGVGSTNLVQRPSAEMSEISTEEMRERVPLLLDKVARYRPRVLAFVGMKICEIVLRHLHNLPLRDTEQSASSSPSKKRRPAMPKVKIGLQPAVVTYPPVDTKDGPRQTTYIWCLPSSSARVVEYQLVDKIEIWKDLKRDIGLLNSGQSPLKADEVIHVEYPIEAVLPPAREEITSPHFKVTPIKREEVGMSALGR
ncbi:DNA glycosylase [Rhodotorula sp. JG-1b]|nr:DNA glycosylase [Rhodotorula sp. JG-1b]